MRNVTLLLAPLLFARLNFFTYSGWPAKAHRSDRQITGVPGVVVPRQASSKSESYTLVK